MPADLWTDAARMAASAGIVAAVAIPIGLLALVVARRRGESLLPRWKGWRVPWTGFEVLIGLLLFQLVPFIVYMVLVQSSFFQEVYGPDFPRPATKPGAVPTPEAVAALGGAAAARAVEEQTDLLSGIRSVWAGVLSLPVFAGLVLFVRSRAYAGWRPARGPVAARVALAVAAWAILTPAVLLLHAGVGLLFSQLDWTTEEHPLVRLIGGRPFSDQLLIVLQACVTAPVLEELYFRGVVLGWLVGGAGAFGLRPLSGDRRAWLVLAASVVLAWVAGRGELGPVAFALGLAAGWAVLRRVFRRKRCVVGGIYASAALFAAVHSGVWPSPVPLFVLALGLGWLAVRTRGLLVPVVVHGLFNAVSALFVLRG